MRCKHDWSPWIMAVNDMELDAWRWELVVKYAGLIRYCNKCFIAQFDKNTLGDANDKTDLKKAKTKQSKKKTSKRKKK